MADAGEKRASAVKKLAHNECLSCFPPRTPNQLTTWVVRVSVLCTAFEVLARCLG